MCQSQPELGKPAGVWFEPTANDHRAPNLQTEFWCICSLKPSPELAFVLSLQVVLHLFLLLLASRDSATPCTSRLERSRRSENACCAFLSLPAELTVYCTTEAVGCYVQVLVRD